MSTCSLPHFSSGTYAHCLLATEQLHCPCRQCACLNMHKLAPACQQQFHCACLSQIF
jgi:hypothetical protein